ncbi:MAG: helix-turn-helix domain-containing protein, partial [Hydrogenophaga sp.]
RSDSQHIEADEVLAVLTEAGLTLQPLTTEISAEPVQVPDLEAAVVPLPVQIAALEQRAIRDALARTGGNRAAAARLLGISRASLYDRLGDAENV